MFHLPTDMVIFLIFFDELCCPESLASHAALTWKERKSIKSVLEFAVRVLLRGDSFRLVMRDGRAYSFLVGETAFHILYFGGLSKLEGNV